MKYLKTYKLYENTMEDHIQTLKDIALDLEDDGYVVDIKEDLISYKVWDIYVTINKDGYRKDEPLVDDVVNRMKEYMDQFGYASKVYKSARAPYKSGVVEYETKDTMTNTDVRFGIKGRGYFK